MTAVSNLLLVCRQSWKRHTKPKALTEADVRENAGTDSALSCPICSRLLREAVRTPCCKTLYCEECIHTTLLDQDFVCPNCESKVASLDKLKPDEEARQQVEDFVKSELQKSKEANGGEGSESETDSAKDVKKEDSEGSEEAKKEDEVSLLPPVDKS